MEAALTVLRCVHDAEKSFTSEQQQVLAGMLHPYTSLEAVMEDLESASKVLGTNAGTAADDVGDTANPAADVLVEPVESAADECATAKAEAV